MDLLRDELETMKKLLKKSQKTLKMGLKRLKIMKRLLIKIKRKKPLKIRFKQVWDRFVGCLMTVKKKIRYTRRWRHRLGGHGSGLYRRRELNFGSPPVGIPVSEDDQHIDSSTSVYGFPESSYHSVIGFPLVEDNDQQTKSRSNYPEAHQGLNDHNNTDFEENAQADDSFSTIHESHGTSDDKFPFYEFDCEQINNLKESASASDVLDTDWEEFVNQSTYAIFRYENVWIRGID